MFLIRSSNKPLNLLDVFKISWAAGIGEKWKRSLWSQGEKLFNNVSRIKSRPKECFHVQDKQKGQKETKLVSKICERGLAEASITQHRQSIEVHLQVLTTTLHQPSGRAGRVPDAGGSRSWTAQILLLHQRNTSEKNSGHRQHSSVAQAITQGVRGKHLVLSSTSNLFQVEKLSFQVLTSLKNVFTFTSAHLQL